MLGCLSFVTCLLTRGPGPAKTATWESSRGISRQRKSPGVPRATSDPEGEVKVLQLLPAGRQQQIWWGRAMANAEPEAILTLFEKAGHRFSGRNLATAAHRLAKRGGRRFRDDPRVAQLAEGCRRRVGDFNSQEMAITAWAFATASVAAPRLFEAIAAEASARIRQFTPQQLANTAWAFATASVVAPRLLEAIADEAPRRIHEFNSQGLANTAWAFATASVAAPRLFETIADEAARRIDEFKSQGLANTAWAFATASVVAPRLLEAIADEAPRRIHEFNSHGLAKTAWAFATASVAAPRLFEAIADETRRRIREFNAQEMANTAWAFATASVAAPRLFEAIADETRRRIREFNAQEMANTIWAFACVDWDQDDIFMRLGSTIEAKLDEFEDVELSQIYIAALYVHVRWPDLDFPLLEDGRPLESLRAAYLKTEPRPSKTQRDVSAMLEELGWTHTSEYVTDEGLSLDVAQTGTKQAIEVDGPSHFLEDASSGKLVANGSTQFKLRLLRSLGWRITSVSFAEWYFTSKLEQERLLITKLKSIGMDCSNVTAK
mmetsp:Transcript_25318/g.81901  ORF Transcript_25318/g.81901 Transcript_25318/m.81901 type:complete len:551 (-) Transcript_25318:1772-3424(-)